ncbi:MAG: biotin/lipoyl-containing protein, partial [Pseudomonadota bacterium]
MPIQITMPALSPTMEEGNLAKWLVKEGDTVASGDILAEIETDKATMEVEAVDEGTIAKILIAEGTEAVKVNEVIAILAEEGEDVAEAAASGGAAAPAPAAEAAPAPAATEAAAPVTATAAGDSIGGAPSAIAEGGSAGPVPVKDGQKVPASPLARRIASNAGIEITTLTGSGPKGRIVKRDVDAALAS